jgi:hypothetical protein
MCVVTYIQPHLIFRGVIGLAALPVADSSGDANPNCFSQLDGFMK